MGRLLFHKDHSLFAYLGFSLPKARSDFGPCFMFYAVSVGEVKAISSLFKEMKKSYPTASFYVACRTKTGLEEAKRSLGGAVSYFLLPFDFSWICKKLVNHLRFDALLVVEGDLWYNLLKAAREKGSLVCLISAKISLRSYKRFSLFPFFSKKLFGFFTLICAQNAVFAKRFIDLGADPSSVLVTGNIKLGVHKELLQNLDLISLRQKLGIEEKDFVIVVGSTHDPEEADILKAFRPLWSQFPHMKCLIVPRHPERFLEVRQLLSSEGIPFTSFSSLRKKTRLERVLLIDEMGLLSDLYQLADVAIVGGSFNFPLKGHNILEPIWVGSPVLFGPYMEDQADLVSLVLSFQAGLQVDISNLTSSLEFFMKDPEALASLKKKGKDLLLDVQGADLRTLDPLRRHIQSIL